MRSHQRDFAPDRRIIFLCMIAVVIGAVSTVAAFVLLNLIHFFTNLFFFADKLSAFDTEKAQGTIE